MISTATVHHGAKGDRPIAHVGSYIVEPASRQAPVGLVKVAVLRGAAFGRA